MKWAVLLAGLAACGTDDPCDGVAGACITLNVSAPGTERVDQLELDLLYGGIHATTTLAASGFPVALAVELTTEDGAHVGIVAAGKLAGTVLAAGAGALELGAMEHATLSLVLASPQGCTAGAFYCGGDKLAGDPQTLYQCNGGGVPLARGRCLSTCSVRPTADDTCRGEGACVEGGFYCGGDKLDGDPQRLYRCEGGAAGSSMVCADGCIVSPGRDDTCR